MTTPAYTTPDFDLVHFILPRYAGCFSLGCCATYLAAQTCTAWSNNANSDLPP
ncbi:hypothetical protein OE88DRAFT_1667915 [Heliocybe sulcata]|uniref:Uncharacterized protein n=1 Tax=Heliocybe sulcata TaxID=5364 RepID=A0A5C3MLT9_9AGAM|nr:hypothetical protein OE88DRAFT_1667915 [Heliocybe sulcata]